MRVLISFIFLAFTSVTVGQDFAGFRPAESAHQRLQEQLHLERQKVLKELVALEAAYAKTVDETYGQLETVLKELLEKETKAGRLENALKLKSAMEQMAERKMKDRVLPSKPTENTAITEAFASPLPRLAGTTWVRGKDVFEFDGSTIVTMNGKKYRSVACDSDEIIVILRNSELLHWKFIGGYNTASVSSNGKTAYLHRSKQ